jgi:4-azaleucine resistance transporter AzlC
VQSAAGSAPSGWSDGLSAAVPVALGYIPVSFAYGLIAQKAGIAQWNIVLMSVLVYAGASQLVAVRLLSQAISPFSVIATTFIVNLRHSMMSAAMAPLLTGWRVSELAAFGFQLTDETFAIHSAKVDQRCQPRAPIFGTNVAAHASWVLGSWLGAISGQAIADVHPLGLDYALPALFVALLVLQVKNMVDVVVATAAGVLAVVLLRLGFDRWYVLVATAAGATLGVLTQQWINDRSS